MILAAVCFFLSGIGAATGLASIFNNRKAVSPGDLTS